MKTAAAALAEFERERNTLNVARLKLVGVVGLIIAFYMVALSLVHFDLGRLAKGLPRIGHWLATAWPPKFSEMPIFLWRTAETIAMAAIGTTLAVIFALPLAVFASRNLTPLPQFYHPIRWFLNALRGIDSFVFALLFVAAVGLGPFAGVLGIALHTAGTAAKFFADQIESSNLGPYDAICATGAGRLTAIAFALVPDVLPALASIALYMWEFNLRSSTVLGVVGAGGIGQELKNSIDLLDFSRLMTIVLIIVAMVTAIDQFSAK